MAEPMAKPIDLDHLNVYTGGDSTLNCQILGLFDGQCHEIIKKLSSLAAGEETAETAKNWREIIHSLMGAARGVGAFKLGEIAAEAEKMRLSDNMEVLETVERLKANAATVHQFIDDLISKSS
jgi:HPt (histidine-containing phosphotransfer) domain-containing protein